MPKMADKVALISGATGGIGSATARLFAAEGARLIVGDLNRQAVDALVDDLISSGAEVIGCVLDVTDASSWESAVRAGLERFAHLDTLINVAGVVSWPGVEGTDQQTWDRVIAVNQTGTWLGMKTALPALRESGNASIVNTSSVLGIIGGGAAAAYQASKGAVRILTKTAAVEYATQGVRVNSIHPGVIVTPMIQEILDEEGDEQRDIQRTPMKRAGTAEEVAAGMLFLASDDSSFVTGAELVIDGGLTAH